MPDPLRVTEVQTIEARLAILEAAVDLLLSTFCMSAVDPDARCHVITDDIMTQARQSTELNSIVNKETFESVLESRMNALKSIVSDMTRQEAVQSQSSRS